MACVTSGASNAATACTNGSPPGVCPCGQTPPPHPQERGHSSHIIRGTTHLLPRSRGRFRGGEGHPQDRLCAVHWQTTAGAQSREPCSGSTRRKLSRVWTTWIPVQTRREQWQQRFAEVQLGGSMAFDSATGGGRGNRRRRRGSEGSRVAGRGTAGTLRATAWRPRGPPGRGSGEGSGGRGACPRPPATPPERRGEISCVLEWWACEGKIKTCILHILATLWLTSAGRGKQLLAITHMCSREITGGRQCDLYDEPLVTAHSPTFKHPTGRGHCGYKQQHPIKLAGKINAIQPPTRRTQSSWPHIVVRAIHSATAHL